MKKWVWMYLLFLCGQTVSAQPAYHEIDKAQWEKAVEGLNYYEKKPEPKESKDGEEDLSEINMPETRHPFVIDSNLMRVILFTLIGIVLVYLILRVFGINLFARNQKVPATVVTGADDLEERPMETDLERHLRMAVEAKDYRTAIRIYYLMILKNLQDNHWIIWRKNKTNYDYLLESGDHPLHGRFRSNTRIFEYVWYGEQYIDESVFLDVSRGFTEMISNNNVRK